jgi:chemotaxis protein MotB
MALRRRSNDGLGGAIWPGFVDAMTAMLLVLTFVLSIFMITQYFLRETITGQEDTIQQQEEDIEQKERALDTLSSRLDSLSDMLSLERTETEKLTAEGTRLRTSLATSEESRAALDEELDAERAAIAKQRAETAALEALAADLRAKAAADLEKLTSAEAALSEAETKKLLEQETAKALRKRLETSTTALTAMELTLDQQRAEAEETLTLLAAANAARTEAEDELESRDADLSRQQALLKVARMQLATVEETTEDEQRQVALLNEQTRTLRAQLSALENRLAMTEAARDTAETTAEDQGEEIASLGTRLNAALADRTKALEEREAALLANRELLEAQVDELEGFRSEFFGQVRKILGDREEIEIVGDRFVFQSEVLFAPASADLADAGKAELGQFAAILNEIAEDIPSDVNWILRIDGHTDKRPLRNSPRYADNWALSQARALSVAQYLIREHDVPSERLAPTGFGEFQPLDDGNSARALARNRRIELKLTER